MPDFAVVTAFRATDKISPAFNRMGAAADKFGDRASRSFGRASAASGAFMGALRGLLPVIGAATVLKFANDSIEAWNRQAVAIANVEAGLASTNNAIGMTSKQFQDMASRWQDVGIFGDETILQNVTAQLLTFGSITKQNFDRMQGSAMDITAKLYGVKASSEQLMGVTIMLGKAMDDPARGMTALRRRGIQFTDAQEKLIETTQRLHGREAAQALLLKEIESLYGGVNAAIRKTDAGMEIAARNKLGDTMEVIGKMLVPMKQALLDLAVEILPVLTDVLSTAVNILTKMKTPIMWLIGGFAAWKVATWAVILAQKAQIALGWIKYLWMMREFIMKATTAQWLWNIALTANPIGLIIVGVAALIAIGVLLYKNWDLVKEKFLSAVSWMWDGIKMIGRGFMTYMMFPINLILTGVSKLFQLASKLPGVGGKFASAAQAVSDFQAKANSTLGSTNLLAPNGAREGGRSGVDFQGTLNITGAPNGSTVSSKTRGAPPINMNLVGAQ